DLADLLLEHARVLEVPALRRGLAELGERGHGLGPAARLVLRVGLPVQGGIGTTAAARGHAVERLDRALPALLVEGLGAAVVLLFRTVGLLLRAVAVALRPLPVALRLLAVPLRPLAVALRGAAPRRPLLAPGAPLSRGGLPLRAERVPLRARRGGLHGRRGPSRARPRRDHRHHHRHHSRCHSGSPQETTLPPGVGVSAFFSFSRTWLSITRTRKSRPRDSMRRRISPSSAALRP